MTKDEHDKAILHSVEKNHMWINAFSLIRPTEETKIAIGEWVIDQLKDSESLVPSFYGDDDVAQELGKLTPQFYCRFNAS